MISYKHNVKVFLSQLFVLKVKASLDRSKYLSLEKRQGRTLVLGRGEN